eukprot:m.105687 g.105687  ORF g.105687 m.105687 type:complete len:505 (+) comp15734_c0_seq1:58-1572(+)
MATEQGSHVLQLVPMPVMPGHGPSDGGSDDGCDSVVDAPSHVVDTWLLEPPPDPPQDSRQGSCSPEDTRVHLHAMHPAHGDDGDLHHHCPPLQNLSDDLDATNDCIVALSDDGLSCDFSDDGGGDRSSGLGGRPRVQAGPECSVSAGTRACCEGRTAGHARHAHHGTQDCRCNHVLVVSDVDTSGAGAGASSGVITTGPKAVHFTLSDGIVVVPPVCCGICMMDTDDGAGAMVVLPCSHEFCQDCLGSHVLAALQDGRIPAVCPELGCAGTLPLETVQTLVDTDPYLRYRRLALLRSDKRLCECPTCGAFQRGNPEQSSVMVCSECEVEYCFFHGLAHKGSTCAEFTERTAKDDIMSRRVINQLSKPCPGCGMPIELAGGCPHVKCWSCGEDFCFQCGTSNLKGNVIKTCTVCHVDYLNHAYLPLFGLIWLLLLPLWVLVTTIALVANVLCCPCMEQVWEFPRLHPWYCERIACVLCPFYLPVRCALQLNDWTCPCSSCPCDEL